MKYRHFTKRIMLLQALGYGVLILLIWANELVDLRYYLMGEEPNPPNWIEGLIESGVVLGIAIMTMYWSHRITVRLKRLEGLLPICSYCKKIRTSGDWVSVEEYVSEHSDAQFSHGCCPECAKRELKGLGKED